MEIVTIGKIYTLYDEKFGIPRQSGMVDLPAKIVFEPKFRDINSIRGLEGFSHIWVLWQFSKVKMTDWQPTVRPPRLGGNKRMGVFATRSPFRPNPIGMSSLKLNKIEVSDKEGPVVYVSGADMLNGTPIIDIKPYISFSDSHPNAVCGFSESYRTYKLKIEIDKENSNKIPLELQKNIFELLSCDPRPSYQNDPNRIYRVKVAGLKIEFKVNKSVLKILSIDNEV